VEPVSPRSETDAVIGYFCEIVSLTNFSLVKMTSIDH
jgi:hypothetical protein